MKAWNGCDDFEGRFDHYRWSAPDIDSQRELIDYLETSGIVGKTVVGINAIGKAWSPVFPERKLAYRLEDMGLLPRSRAGSVGSAGEIPPWLRKRLPEISVPQQVTLCEPLQLVFADGSTLEIMPTDRGGARVGINTIPEDLRHGLNDSNFDAKSFFRELIGGRIEKIWAERICRSTDVVRFGTKEYSFGGRSRRAEDDYSIVFGLSHGVNLRFLWDWHSTYMLQTESFGAETMTVPYDRVLRCLTDSRQIEIIRGRASGGNFWIYPISLDGREIEDFESCMGATIEEVDLLEHLLPFLEKHIDPSLQQREWYENPGFEEYGCNIYSLRHIGSMLEDIAASEGLLRQFLQDGSDRSFAAWEESLPPYGIVRHGELREQEKRRFKDKAPYIADFYERFRSCIESIMTLDGCDAISFAGP